MLDLTNLSKAMKKNIESTKNTTDEEFNSFYLSIEEAKTIPNSSMLYWYPRIKNLPIPQPNTKILECSNQSAWYRFIDGDGSPPFNNEELKNLCSKMGYPCFLRTDHGSAKHSWKDTCYIENENSLDKNLFPLIEQMVGLADLPCHALVVREFITMDTLFTAFHGEMPVNPEIRVFVNEGKIQCHHWYWYEGAIESGHVEPSDPNWRKKIEAAEFLWLNNESVQTASNLVVKEFPKDTSWSVDFCRGKDCNWYLIDMALAKQSWHPEDCPYS